MDNLNFTSLFAPNDTPVIPADFAVKKQKYDLWLAQNPNGPPVDFATWQAGQEQQNQQQVQSLSAGVPKASVQDYIKGIGDSLFSPAPVMAQGGNDEQGMQPIQVGRQGILGNEAMVSGQVAKQPATYIDSMLGSGTQVQDVAQRVGEGLPRMVATSAVGGLPAWVADSGLQTYGETGSVGQAALSSGITAGTLGLAKYGGQAGEKFVADQLTKLITPEVSGVASQALNRGLANEALTGALPKIGGAVGAGLGGVVGQETGRQIETGGSIPGIGDVASDVATGLMFAAPQMISAFRGGQNVQGTKSLLERMYGTKIDPLDPVTPEIRFQKLLDSSVSNTDMDPQWRRSMVVTGMQDLGKTMDPTERALKVSQLTEAVLQSRDLTGLETQAEMGAKMAYIQPPQDAEGLARLVKQVNGLKTDVLSKIDELAASGEGGVSAAAYEQLAKQGFLKETIDMAWIQKNYDENLARSLSNSGSEAYAMTVQQLANRQIILAEAAKEARGEALTQQSIEAPAVSSARLEDRRVIGNFFEAASKISDPELQGQLYDRFNYHEDLDNKTNRGTAPKFMAEVTDVINKMTEGKSPEELAQIDWSNTPVTTQKRAIAVDEAGVETRSLHDEQVTLGDYLATDDAGRYTRSVYGRPEGQSQRELASGIKPPEAALSDAQDLTTSNTWAATADQVRGHIDSIDAPTAWSKIIAPAIAGDRQIRSDVERRLAPISKDLVMAVFEAGPKMVGGEEGSRVLGESGKKVLAALGGSSLKDRSEYGQLAMRLKDTLGGSGRDVEAVKKEIVRRAAELAGVKGPEVVAQEGGQATAMTTQAFTPWPQQKTAVVGNHGASGTGDPRQDTYRTIRTALLNMGREPEMVDRYTTIALQILDNMYNPALQVTSLSPRNAYPKSLGKAQQSREDLYTGGVYGNLGDQPIIGMATGHTAGKGDPALAGAHLIEMFSHELVHDVQDWAHQWRGLTPPTAYLRQVVGAYNQLAAAAATYSPQRKFELLQLLYDATTPHSMLYKDGVMDAGIAGNINYLANKTTKGDIPDYEFVNGVVQILTKGMVTGGNGKKFTADEVFTQLPEEVALYAKGFYRDLHDMMDVVKSAIVDSIEYSQSVGATGYDLKPSYYAEQIEKLVDLTYKMVVSKEPQLSLARAQALMQSLEGKNWAGPITAVYFPNVIGQSTAIEHEAEEGAMRSTHDLFFGTKDQQVPMSASAPVVGNPQGEIAFSDPENENLPTKVNIGLFWKTIGLTQQSLDHLSRRGLPLANDLGDLMRGYMPMQNRIISGIWSPFLTVEGKPDKTNPLITAINDKSIQGRRDVAARNKLIEWAQRADKSPLEQDAQGNWQLTTEAKKDLGGLDVNQRVVGGVKALEDVGNRTGLTIVHSRADSVAFRVARMIMTVEKRVTDSVPWDAAYANASKIVQGMLYLQPKLTSEALDLYSPDTQQAVLGMLQSGTSANGATKDGLIDKLRDLKDQVMKRTWWSSEQRPGQYMVVSWQQGVRKVDGAQSKLEAMRIKNQLEKTGYDKVSIVDKSERQRIQGMDAPEGLLLDFKRLEQEAMDRYCVNNPNNLTPYELNMIRSFGPEPGAAVEQALEQRGLNKYLIHRRSVPSALGLDYADNMQEYVSRLASTVARQHLAQKTALILSDDRMIGQDEIKLFMDHALNQLFTPTSELERSMKAGIGGYYLAANVSSGVVNMFDAVNILPETLVSNGADVTQAYGHVLKGIADVVHYSRKENILQARRDYNSAQLKLALKQKLTPEEFKAYGFMNAIGNKTIDKGVLQDVFENQDLTTLIKRQFGYRGETNISDAALSSDGLYRLIRGIVAIPRFAHGFNNKVAYMAGYEQAIAQGMDVAEATRHADKIRSLGVFAGGKTNMPSYMGRYGNKYSIPLMRTFHVLQQYTYGMVGRWMNDLSDSISNDPGLTPMQQRQARKALGTLVVTAIAVAGLMGLPIAGLMVLSDKIFGTNFEVDTRKGLAWLAGAEKDNTGLRGLVAESAMNGIPNQLLGVNIGPRVGISNAFGLSTYNGFNIADLTAASSVVTQMATGLGELAQGQTQKGTVDLVPAFLKRGVNLAFNKSKYGDYQLRAPTDGEPMMDPNAIQLGLYGAGFNPSQLSERQRFLELKKDSNDRFIKNQARQKVDAAIALRQGDMGPTQKLVVQQLSDNPLHPMTAVKETLRSVADKAAAMNQPQDLFASTPAGNAQEVQDIARTFPSRSVPIRSELDAAQGRMGAQAQVGSLPAKPSKVLTQAAMVDELVRQGVPKAQAQKMVREMK